MNNCLCCNKETKNKKFCSISCQNKFQKANQINNKLGLFKEFVTTCNKCGNNFIVTEREKLFPQKEKYYCSKSCANSRTHDNNTKEKISEKMKEYCNSHTHKKRMVKIICKECKKEFEVPYHKRNKKYCNRKCYSISMIDSELSRRNGILSSQKQKENRRSKNEIYFSELCKNKFKKVLTNEPIFNGWDADIIIEDFKIAVLWNGKWHYEKITKTHSVKQVKNRDEIKIKEIQIKGYKCYIIKDMGRENENFVKNEFNKFIDFFKI